MGEGAVALFPVSAVCPLRPPRGLGFFAARCDRAPEPKRVPPPPPPPAAGRELSGKGSVLAAGREFDGLLCGPRGFSLIPLCVLACSPLPLSDKLPSRRLPVPVKKGQLSRRALNPWPLGPGGAGAGEQVWRKEGVGLLPSVWPLFFLTVPAACAPEVAFRVGFSGVCGSPAKLWASAVCAHH